MILLFPREPAQRLVKEKRKRKQLAIYALQAPGDSPALSSQISGQAQKGMPDSHCQLLTAPEGGAKTDERTSLLDVRPREEEIVMDTLMFQRCGKGPEQEHLASATLMISSLSSWPFLPIQCCCGDEVDPRSPSPTRSSFSVLQDSGEWCCPFLSGEEFWKRMPFSAPCLYLPDV